jgi:hypothetical protein
MGGMNEREGGVPPSFGTSKHRKAIKARQKAREQAKTQEPPRPATRSPGGGPRTRLLRKNGYSVTRVI